MGIKVLMLNIVLFVIVIISHDRYFVKYERYLDSKYTDERKLRRRKKLRRGRMYETEVIFILIASVITVVMNLGVSEDTLLNEFMISILIVTGCVFEVGLVLVTIYDLHLYYKAREALKNDGSRNDGVDEKG